MAYNLGTQQGGPAMSSGERSNWLDSMAWQVDFYRRSGRARRHDPEFEWGPYERSPSGRLPETRRLVKGILHRLGLRDRPPMTLDWLRDNAARLWETRTLLADELSRLLFDAALVVRLTDHRRFYFPRIDFDDLLATQAEQPFTEPGFPHDYLGVPLGVFDVRLLDRSESPVLRIITRGIQLRLVNSYRQYLVRRNGYDISPMPGDVVYDCGACIGEISLLFVGLVAPAGEVHLFDPIALHTRFCALQQSLNPALGTRLHINTCAVGGSTHAASGTQADSGRIVPGAVSTAAFACTTLDDYAAARPGRVDFIKMDIEGAEMEALSGAARVIGEFKPRLAISGYHKPEDLWEIPAKLKELNPGYEITFGHHTPIGWESVFYAIDRDAEAGRR
jgi:FkbM family methyltransferase